ncbi:PIN domain-containing protein, partial [Escherichia coli]|nr:PIN domain-containing protein [Escherichia coli]
DELDPIVVTVALDRMIAKTMASIARDLVPDMPDRIIAATARALGLPLVTRDLGIRRAGLTTIW